MEQYNKTFEFWEKVFDDCKEYDIGLKLKYSKLDNAIEWLTSGSESILDFGCGVGTLLYRCLLNENVKRIKGIDLSKSAIKLAKDISVNNDLTNKTEFICGGISVLKTIEDNSFDGCILSNIIDNLKPDDANFVIKEINRILKVNGKLIIKLNPYLDEKTLKKYSCKKVDEDFFVEDTGLYLWNLTNKKVEQLFTTFFHIKKYEEIYFKEFDMTNRVYYLENN